jgi:hypothetical protein
VRRLWDVQIEDIATRQIPLKASVVALIACWLVNGEQKR